MASTGGDNDKSDDEKDHKWDGDNEKTEAFIKKIGRWCRKKYGTTLGNMLWENSLPTFLDLGHGQLWQDHCEVIWEAINEVQPTKAKGLYEVNSGFWQHDWHERWRKQQYDRIFDKVESCVSEMALLEVEALGMENSPDLRKTLLKQFGGAGDDVRAREERYEAGMPEYAGAPVFPKNVNMENKLRTLYAERSKLLKLCKPSLRAAYEVGKETRLVKIVIRFLRGTEYQEVVEKLLQEVKMRQEFKAQLPVRNPSTGELEMPPAVEGDVLTDDWDFRNFSDEWLPSWAALKSKLVSYWKQKGFDKPAKGAGGKGGSAGGQTLPVMMAPGGGANNRIRCFGCGEYGHRKSDPECKAGKDEWHESAPKSWQPNKKHKSGKGGKGGKGKGKGGADGMRGGNKNAGVCYEFQKTGKCRFGPNCKYKHATTSNVNLTKGQRKSITVAAVKELKRQVREKANEEGVSHGNDEFQNLLKGFMYVKTIPRERMDKEVIDFSSLKVSNLMDMETDVCWDSGSAMGISTDLRDMVYVDSSDKAKESVILKGPSVGKPGCEGRGPLVYRKLIDGVPHGYIHPKGVLADGTHVKFRIGSERIMKQRGVRVLAGEFDGQDVLECVRSKQVVNMSTKDNILIMETEGRANEIVDSPEFRKVVDEVDRGTRSPLVNLQPYLKGGVKDENDCAAEASKLSSCSFLTKFLLLTTVLMAVTAPTLILNEAKLTKEERSRLWVRKLAYCSSSLFPKMKSMPEYGNMPDIWELNEDNIVGDLAKFKKQAHKRNDPEVTMDCPPWWRVYVDGYGGQLSLGGESYEGAVGAYIFVCVSTGSTDVKLYASHEQFPVALAQFLARVEAEHFKNHCVCVNTHSVNLSQDALEGGS